MSTKSNFHHGVIDTVTNILQDFEVFKLETSQPEKKVWLGDGSVKVEPGDTLTITITAKTKNNVGTN